MNSRPQNSASARAFTLIELLTVITIIAILMGLLFPAIGVVKEQARKAEARGAVAQIAAAVKQYYTEYGKYPVGEQDSSKDIIYGETGLGNEKLFDILRNIPSGSGKTNQYNPRGIVYFEAKTAGGDPKFPKSGFVGDGATNVAKGAFVDPWGQEYRVAIDSDYDNVLTGLPYSDFGSTNAPRTGVGVFSLGKDASVGDKDKFKGQYRSGGNTSDDIITWN